MTNPYHPATVTAAQPNLEFRDRDSLPRVVAIWLAVLTANLIVPLMLAAGMLNYYSRIGVAAGLMFFAISGIVACRFLPALANRIIAGGVITAFSQLLPILHIVAGSVAFNVAKTIGHAEGNNDWMADRILTTFGGILVTLLTGSAIAFVALLAGSALLAFSPRFATIHSGSG